jgi:hypothetical protein
MLGDLAKVALNGFDKLDLALNETRPYYSDDDDE